MTAELAARAAVPARHTTVGVLGAAGLVAGSMVGSGVFLLPATLAAVGSISVLGWLAATLAALAIAGVFAWLGQIAQQAQGLPGYVRAGLGRFFAVQTAVAYWTSNWVGLVALALAIAGAAGFLVPALAPPGPRLAVTIAAIWLGVAAAWAGPRSVARLEGLTLAVGLLPVILAATVGWFAFDPGVFTASWDPHGLAVGEAVKSSGLSAFWAFLGLECAAATAGVVRDPARNVPRATLLGVTGVAALYISASVVMMGLLPAERLASSTAPFADAARDVLGAGLGAGIALCVMIRAQGCLAGWALVTAETTRSAADEGEFPALFRTRPGERASAAGLLAVGGLMTAVAVFSADSNLAREFSLLINVVSLFCLYTYVMAAASLIRLARDLPGRRRAGAMLTAAAAIGCSGFLILSARPLELAWSLTPLPAAALLYLWLRRR